MSNERKLDKAHRPIVFGQVLGQDGTVKVLRNTLKDIDNEVMPSIFFGPWGSGKTTQARIYARAILCTNRTAEQDPCNVCDSCEMFFSDTHPGYTEINGADLTGVDGFRKVLEETEYSVAGSQYRVYLIDECHMMSKSAQNLFLKPLEEGIPGVFFFFCTTEYEKIIPTIQSRCVDFAIRTIPIEGIAARVGEICEAEGIVYEPDAVTMLVQAKKGHFRDVLVFVGQIRDLGGVTEEVVFEYLDLGVTDAYFEVLLHLKDDVGKAMSALDRALTRVSAQDVYNGLTLAAMDVFKTKHGIRCSLVVRDSSLRDSVYDVYGDAVTGIGSYLITHGSRRIDSNYLSSTLLLMRERLMLGVGLEGNERVVIREVAAPRAATPTTTPATSTTPAPATRPTTTPTRTSAPPTPARSPRVVLTQLDEKARRKKSKKEPEKAKRLTGSTEDALLSGEEFGLLLQQGIRNGR